MSSHSCRAVKNVVAVASSACLFLNPYAG